MVDVAQVIHRLVAEFELSPDVINNGFCADFACAVQERIRSARIVSDEDLGRDEYTHTFVQLGGRFYDAESPSGVDDWRNLPIFGRQ